MKRILRWRRPGCLALAVLALAAPLSLVRGQDKDKATVPAGGAVNITVTTGGAPPPPATIVLLDRLAQAVPHRAGCQHTGGGNIEVVQPSPDVVVITMTAAAVASANACQGAVAGEDFDLEQCFEVVDGKPAGKKLKLTLEARVIGLLRSYKGGFAEESGACASVSSGHAALVTVCAPPRTVSGCQNLSINDHAGPVPIPVAPGKYTLHQTFHIGADHSCALFPCRGASAEFAPEPALDPLWISYREPFHGAIKKDFGFQVILKVAEEEEAEGTNGGKNGKKGPESLPPPKKEADAAK
jgi:hypothetical protein